MEAEQKHEKITHRLPTIQFTDKAIENLKWNKQTNKRQRIKVRFKNGGYFRVDTFFGRHYVNRCDKNGDKIKSNIIPFKKLIKH